MKRASIQIGSVDNGSAKSEMDHDLDVYENKEIANYSCMSLTVIACTCMLPLYTMPWIVIATVVTGIMGIVCTRNQVTTGKISLMKVFHYSCVFTLILQLVSVVVFVAHAIKDDEYEAWTAIRVGIISLSVVVLFALTFSAQKKVAMYRFEVLQNGVPDAQVALLSQEKYTSGHEAPVRTI